MCQDIGACKVEDEHSFQRYWDHYMMGHNGAFPYKTEAQDPVQMEKVRKEGRKQRSEGEGARARRDYLCCSPPAPLVEQRVALA